MKFGSATYDGDVNSKEFINKYNYLIQLVSRDSNSNAELIEKLIERIVDLEEKVIDLQDQIDQL